MTSDGTKLLLGAALGKIFEFGPPLLTIVKSGTDVVLSWPVSVTAVVVQSATTLSPPNFADLSPQPTVVINGNMNTATLPIGAGNEFYRLRKSP